MRPNLVEIKIEWDFDTWNNISWIYPQFFLQEIKPPFGFFLEIIGHQKITIVLRRWILANSIFIARPKTGILVGRNFKPVDKNEMVSFLDFTGKFGIRWGRRVDFCQNFGHVFPGRFSLGIFSRGVFLRGQLESGR